MFRNLTFPQNFLSLLTSMHPPALDWCLCEIANFVEVSCPADFLVCIYDSFNTFKENARMACYLEQNSTNLGTMADICSFCMQSSNSFSAHHIQTVSILRSEFFCQRPTWHENAGKQFLVSGACWTKPQGSVAEGGLWWSEYEVSCWLRRWLQECRRARKWSWIQVEAGWFRLIQRNPFWFMLAIRPGWNQTQRGTSWKKVSKLRTLKRHISQLNRTWVQEDLYVKTWHRPSIF